MRIAFFGWHRAFGFNRIGGADSFVRRLSTQLIRLGDSVDYVHYGSPKTEIIHTDIGVSVRCFQNLNDALKALKSDYNHVITYSVLARDRISFGRFRRSAGTRVMFHKIQSGWSDSRLKRRLSFADARIFPYNGWIFAVSPRLRREMSRWARRTTLLLPPVPRDYFLTPDEKPHSDKIRVTFLGRLDSGKGIREVISIFRSLKEQPDIETKICGFTYPSMPETFAIHRLLSKQSEIQYEHIHHDDYKPEVEQRVRQTLKDTDILLLPYRRLSSTMDTPMLLLEGMASLCAAMTKRFGDIPETYGESKFLLPDEDSLGYARRIIVNARSLLQEERRRILERVASLKFDAESVARRLRRYLEQGHQ